MSSGIVGIDLAGNEAEFPAEPFHGIFREARQAGLHISVHAGEWGPAANVREAIEQLGAERIAHGVRVLEDPSVVALARERARPFEVCVTSNYQSGVVPEPGTHPLPRMLEAGLNRHRSTRMTPASRASPSAMSIMSSARSSACRLDALRTVHPGRGGGRLPAGSRTPGPWSRASSDDLPRVL